MRDLAELFGKQQATAGSQPKATDGGASELLAFVEAEQVLVVRTASGWRPLQLLRPLRDPRLGPRKPTRVAPGGVAFNFGGPNIDIGIDDDAVDDNDLEDEEDDDEDDSKADQTDNNVGRKAEASSAEADDEEELDEDEDEEDEDEDDDADEDATREDQRKAERGRAGGKRRAGRNENELAPLVVGRRRLEGLSSPRASSQRPTALAARVSGRSAMAAPPLPPMQPQQQPQQQLKQKPSQTSINHQADHSSKQPKVSRWRTKRARRRTHGERKHQYQHECRICEHFSEARQIPLTFSHVCAQSFRLRARRAQLRLAALNEPFSGNIHGVRGNYNARGSTGRLSIGSIGSIS